MYKRQANLSFKNRFPHIFVIDEASDSNLAYRCDLPNPTRRKSECGRGLGELPAIWSFPFNISATAEASDFKFGTQHGFAKAHHKITRRRKGGHSPGLRDLPKIWGSPFNIYTMAEASDFKFGIHSLGLPRHIIKSLMMMRGVQTARSGRGLGLGKLPYIWCLL